MSPPNVPDRVTKPRDMVPDPCPSGEHDTRKSAVKCELCGTDLCELCGSDEHWAAGGHDLSKPEYWGV